MKPFAIFFGYLRNMLEIWHQKLLAYVVLAEGLFEVHFGAKTHIGRNEGLQIDEHVFDLLGERAKRRVA